MLIKFLFLSVCLIGLISTFFMILSTQPITRLALLITVFIMSALILIILDFYFLGLTYVIVYVGAIAILFLFVIMMAEAHITPSGPSQKISGSAENTPLILGLSSKSFGSSQANLRIPNNDPVTERSGNHASGIVQAEESCLDNYALELGIILIGLGLYLGLCSFTLYSGLLGDDCFFPFSWLESSHSIFSPFPRLYDDLPYPSLENTYIWPSDDHFYPLSYFQDHNQSAIWNYCTIDYSSEFLTFGDIQSLGFLLYLAYPLITIVLGLILWCVLVGILRISLA